MVGHVDLNSAPSPVSSFISVMSWMNLVSGSSCHPTSLRHPVSVVVFSVDVVFVDLTVAVVVSTVHRSVVDVVV